MESRRPASIDDLLAELGWVRRLAHTLIADAAAADDAAQDALVVTLTQPPGRVPAGAALRAWLRGVVRRLALDRSRSEKSRARRERIVGTRDAPAHPFEVAERGVRQQRVAAAVQSLDEPFRSTVLYRYLDELPTRQVAIRMGVSEDLVRKRLQRALQQLRVSLDADFGTDTKTWALALVPVTGVAVVSTTTKVIAVATIAVGAWIAWRVTFPTMQQEFSNSIATRDAPAPCATAQSTSDRSSSEPRAQLVDGTATAPVFSVSRTSLTSDDVTILRVRVVDGATPCNSGTIACAWSDLSTFAPEWCRPVHDVDHSIDGELTEIVLPRSACSAEISASVKEKPPSERVKIDNLRALEHGHPIVGRVVREVTVDLGHSILGACISGRVLVDGVPRIPPGLRIRLEPPWTFARIHELDARYEAGPLDSRSKCLFVTSDETELRQIEIDPGQSVLDLELDTAHSLELSVVDRATGRPIPGTELFLHTQAEVSRPTPFTATWRESSRFVTTDDQGFIHARGLPKWGRVHIRRNAAEIATVSQTEAGKLRDGSLRDPLLTLELTRELPAVIERTLALDPETAPRIVRGEVDSSLNEPAAPDGHLVLVIHWIQESGSSPGRDGLAAVEGEGRFEFEAPDAAKYRVWAERDDLRVSEVATVDAGDPERAPMKLVPRHGTQVTLRLLRCPAAGFISVRMDDPEALTPTRFTLDSRPGTIEQPLVLEQRIALNLTCGPDRWNEAGKKHRVSVDPAMSTLVEIDLESDNARSIELAVVGADAPDAHVMLIASDAKCIPAGSLRLQFHEGHCAATVVDPGSYLALLFGVSGFAMTRVDVASDVTEPIRLRFELESHPRSALGAGVQIDRVGDFVVDERWRGIFTLRFGEHPELAKTDSILLPARAAYTVLER